MRQRFAVLTILAAAVVGCGPMMNASYSNEPLDGYILPGGSYMGGMAFYVNRPANVAIFRVMPGVGTSLVYPMAGLGRMDGSVYAGLHSASASRASNVAHYLPVTRTALLGPQFYLMIASEEPLDLDQYGAFGDGLSSAMGVQFASNGYTAMSRLVELTVPDVAADNWITDYYVHWPEVLFDRQAPSVVRINCGPQSFYVRADQVGTALRQLCAQTEQAEVEQPTGPAEEEPTEQPEEEPARGSDDGEVIQPRPRRPIAEDRIAGRLRSEQLSSPERWLEMREALTSDPFDDMDRRRARFDRLVEREGRENLEGRSQRLSGSPARQAGRASTSRAVGEPAARESRGSGAPAPAARGAARGGDTRASAPSTPRDGGGSSGRSEATAQRHRAQ
jgi:hypothetical protein